MKKNERVMTGLSVIAFWLLACQYPHQNGFQKHNTREKTMDESFDWFYQNFHKDSVFQLQRITFPLAGSDMGEDYNPIEDKETFYWTKSNWTLMKTPQLDEDMKLEINKNDSTVSERIYIPDSGFEIIRQFTLIQGKWYLTYYGNQNL